MVGNPKNCFGSRQTVAFPVFSSGTRTRPANIRTPPKTGDGQQPHCRQSREVRFCGFSIFIFIFTRHGERNPAFTDQAIAVQVLEKLEQAASRFWSGLFLMTPNSDFVFGDKTDGRVRFPISGVTLNGRVKTPNRTDAVKKQKGT